MKHTTADRLVATLVLLGATALLAAPAPPGLESWGDEGYSLEPGESASFTVDFDDIPVRRWVLLVESDGGVSHLNVRRVSDGSLLFDARDERRHEVDVPWGRGEQLSAVITAGGRGGVYHVSIWGPPRGSYRQSYGYEVNRALEAMDRGDLALAEHHLQAAQRQDPDDRVAALLVAALAQGIVPSESSVVTDRLEAVEDPEVVRLVDDARARAAELIADTRFYEALEQLQTALALSEVRETRIEILVDLVAVYLELDNLEQARVVLAALEALGADPARVDLLRLRIDEH